MLRILLFHIMAVMRPFFLRIQAGFAAAAVSCTGRAAFAAAQGKQRHSQPEQKQNNEDPIQIIHGFR
jgi:hypothetical protein